MISLNQFNCEEETLFILEKPNENGSISIDQQINFPADLSSLNQLEFELSGKKNLLSDEKSLVSGVISLADAFLTNNIFEKEIFLADSNQDTKAFLKVGV